MTPATDQSQEQAYPPPGWVLRHSVGPAKTFHDLVPSPRPAEATSTAPVFDHQVWIHRVDRVAVVLGSTQRNDALPGVDGREETGNARPLELFDAGGGEVELCRRRSGGGLVVVHPVDSVWVDVIVPRWSPLHDDDLTKSFDWFGRCWAEMLSESLADPPSSSVADAPSNSGSAAESGNLRVELAVPPPGRRAAERPFHCFADLGHGEVLLDGRKVVGLSQRRTRHWSRLQALAIRRWDGTAVNRLLTPMLRLPSIESLGRPPYDANQVAAGPGPGVTLARGPDLIRSLLGRLPPIERLD